MEPMSISPDILRYTQIPLPTYQYIPFQPGIPHPRNDPDGHSYGKEDEYLPCFSAAIGLSANPIFTVLIYSITATGGEAHESW